MQTLGLMRIGALYMALPALNILEVVPHPDKLAAFAGVAPFLKGSLRLRGLAIPVLDLAQILKVASDSRSEPVIVVMRHNGCVLGLCVDAVSGIANLPAKRLDELKWPGCSDTELPTHSFEHENQTFMLLDPARIARLPGVPMVCERPDSGDEAANANSAPILLFRCGKLGFGMPVDIVGAATASTVLKPSALQSDICLGVIDYHGKEIPVVDFQNLLGFRENPVAAQTSVLVLRYPENGALGLAIDEVCEIVRVPSDEIHPVPALATASHALLMGAIMRPDGVQHLIFETDGLLNHESLAALARLAHERPDEALSAGTTDIADATAEPYILYAAGGEYASPLGQISEILPYGGGILRMEQARMDHVGMIQHRGAVVPLFDLAVMMGQTVNIDPQHARVLIVHESGVTVGFVVARLRSIERGRRRSVQAAGAAGVSMWDGVVEVFFDRKARILAHMDLQTQVRLLLEATDWRMDGFDHGADNDSTPDFESSPEIAFGAVHAN